MTAAETAAPAATPTKPESVRLVIWDLDDTYWSGTIAEEGMTYLPASQEIVIELARRGIMSSICSKNDPERVRRVLEARGVWDYFIFPSISWEPKGPRIRDIVEAVQLRPPSILFIDDNPSNLQEAAFAVPGIQVADPAILPALLDDARCRGKDDRKLKRLKQYKVLEEKHESRASYSDNSEFLRASNIRVMFEYDVESEIDRAVELINRTNQLNFTKTRLPEDEDEARAELTELLRRQDVQAALIRVVDNYGDYGYAGIFVMDRNMAGDPRLRHFTFSCRILNMHIETWVYRELGRPIMYVRGDVLSDPVGDETKIDWITLVETADADAEAGTEGKRWPAVYLRGGCDLAAITHYCTTATDALVSEVNFMRDGVPVRIDHSLLLWYALKPPAPEVLPVLHKLGYADEDLATQFVEDPGRPGSLRLLSFWADMNVPLYRHRETGVLVPFWLIGGQSDDLTARTAEEMGAGIEKPAARRAWEYLVAEFEFVGTPDRETHLAWLRDIIRAVPAEDQLVILAANRAIPGRSPHVRHAELNERIAILAEEFPQISVIQPADYIEDASEVHDINHFHRMVYFRIYNAIRDGAANPAA